MSLAGIDDRDLIRAADTLLRTKPWRLTARKEQLPPDWDWDIWLILTGRRWGKTLAGCHWVHEAAKSDPSARICLAAPTQADVRKVIVFGNSGIMATAEPGFRPEWHSADLSLTWPNGARADLGSAEEPDRFRGYGFSHAYCDEFAAWAHPEALDMIRMALSLGKRPKLVITTTPRPLPHLRAIMAEPGVAKVQRSIWDNAVNLPKSFLDQMHRRYDNTRLGLQELEGKILEDGGALWTQALLDRTRVGKIPEILAWGVGVDPSGGDKEGNDAQGIGLVGMDANGDIYFVADRTVKLPPAGWGHAAVLAAVSVTPWASIWVERNMGGDVAAHVVRIAARDAGIEGLKIEEVVAKTGKHIRASPVSALWEQGRGHMVGIEQPDGSVSRAPWSEEMEEEMLNFTAEGYIGPKSPNRVDGCVWAAKGLMSMGVWASGQVDEKLEEWETPELTG